MKKSISILSGTLLIISSALLYSFEKLMATTMWAAHRTGPASSEGWPNHPDIPSLLDNWFVPIFLVLGIFFLLKGFLDNKN
ncbi:hypothetical protein LCM10_05200 [Rossellomorea aquimaris]|uniref:hypothetical protein n=1 Tax=Rossellomorea aquimaris TaxID=189382 RepID=UPI001CD70AA4|nr:hypothetical protein [Rossellomorea aquimaris]MCA1054375.1 hypothetical protein [Rossellomorea aquimaris]